LLLLLLLLLLLQAGSFEVAGIATTQPASPTDSLNIQAWMLSTLIMAAYNVLYAYSTLYVALYAVCTLLSRELATYWSKCHWK
jgi:hypothetical protein